jgi:hypothetical protein
MKLRSDLKKDLQKAKNKMLDDAMKIVATAFSETCEKIIMDTPINRDPEEAGKLRNNWNATFISPQSVDRRRNTSGADSRSSYQEVAKKINRKRIGEKINFTNGLHYADEIEFARSKYKNYQQPQGMLRINVQAAGGKYGK